MAVFEELPEHQLQARSDDELISYIRAAREAGRHDAMKPAIGVLAFGYWDNLVNRARLKLPDSDVEQVAGEALRAGDVEVAGSAWATRSRSCPRPTARWCGCTC